jgi:hypothetical protein
MSKLNNVNISAAGIFDLHIEPYLKIIKDITNLTAPQLYDALTGANETEMYEHILAKLEIYLKHKQSAFSFWFCSLDIYYQSLIWNYFCKKNNIINREFEESSLDLSIHYRNNYCCKACLVNIIYLSYLYKMLSPFKRQQFIT